MNNTKPNVGACYSQIIQPADYNRIVSNEHIYMAAADSYLVKKIRELAFPSVEVVELGCGPARVLALIREIEGIRLTGVDLDNQFLTYAQQVIKNSDTQIVMADIETYKHDKEVDIFYSHGLHHHIAKGTKTINYLKNVHKNLKEGGYYILIDEFLPNYSNQMERELKVVIWYSHVIANAIKNNYLYLAQEESKILLDDLYEGRTHENIKNQEQIDLVLASVEPIDKAARGGEVDQAELLAKEFLSKLEKHHNLDKHGDLTIDLSRGDYKICDSVLREEVEKANLIIREVKAFGPAETIGSVSIYTIKKE